DVVADMVEQQNALADIAIGEAHAAGEARFLVHNHADHPPLGELVVGKPKERLVGRRIQPCDSVGHEEAISPANISRFLRLAIKLWDRSMALTFHAGDLESSDVRELLDHHFAQMRTISPPDSCHVLPIDGLNDTAVSF